ncbi:MAG: cytochrome c-type biosis protein CcmH [Acidobacteriota bacterium]|jgi:tetratricopeptide (TPR) repeat protein|nr:cytochrome c-type biosis protein CcmH [Acidobacteriota bacterium]
MDTPTDWFTGLAILAAGLVLGGLFLYFFSRRKSAATIGGEEDLVRKDLEAKRDALIQQLRDLDTDSKFTPEQLSETRARLERETADVLRALDQHRPSPRSAGAAAPTAAPAVAGMSPAIKGFLWGFGSFALLAFLGYFVMQSSTPREEGGSVTGNLPSQPMATPAQPAAAAPDAVVQQMLAQIQQTPEDLRLRNDLAQAYLERDNLMGVFEQTKYVLAKNPNDGRAMTYQAMVRLAMGEVPVATQMLQKATQVDAQNLDAWVGLAWVYAQQDKMDEAQKAIAQAAVVSPASKPRLDEVFEQMKRQIAMAKLQPQGGQGQMAGNELPPNHPPVDGAAPAPAPAPATAPATTGANVRVTLTLDPSAKATTGIVFVIARNPAGGPPYAVKRIDPRSLPMTFDFGAADSMMGQQLPASFRLEARLDPDGDPLSKTPNDPKAVQENVSPGAAVTLAMK